MEFVFKESSDLFNVYSEMSDIDYYIRVVDPNKLEQAMQIAEREIGRWCCVDEIEDDDEYNYYYQAGYCEVVEEELNKAKIIHKIFVNNED